ncbi:hypothetical protein ACIBEK_01740 [Nocardia fusca]|uniref:hypothetical protein n=1 Tax=Nocardia fusca TaxID=941183 RepID=UPI00378D54FF
MTGPYRLIVRGAGDMGGRALRSALESPGFESVGVSGKNVVPAASWHNPSMPTWLSALRSPLSVRRTVADMKVPGNAFGQDHPSSPAGGHVITLDGNPGVIELRNSVVIPDLLPHYLLESS